MPDRSGETTWDELRADAWRHAADRPAGVAEHRPVVAVLSCSDARVPPSVVFGRPAGELFVVRIAGNTASSTAVASLEYAVEQLGAELLVVLGHTSCGAVAAAVDGSCDGSLAPVVAPICEIVAAHPHATPDDVSRLNVAITLDRLVAASPSIARAVGDGRLVVRGAVYDLANGRLVEVEPCAEPVLHPHAAPRTVADTAADTAAHTSPHTSPHTFQEA